MSEPLIQFGKQAEGPANGAIPAARVKVPAPPRPASSMVSVDGVAIAHAAISAEAQQHPAATPAEANTVRFMRLHCLAYGSRSITGTRAGLDHTSE